MELKNKLGWAVVGYGGMGGWHTQEILKSDVVELCGIYDIDEKRLKAAEENGIHAYPTLEALLADEAICGITIATPNECHKPIAIKALRAGKHVISEKPVMLSLEELDAVIAVANECGKLFTVHQNRRWDGENLVMKGIYESGELGKIFHIENKVLGSRGIPGDWRAKPEHGGGMLYDWGIHLIDQIFCIVGDCKLNSVYCTFEHVKNKTVDDGFKLDMYFEDELSARVEVGTYYFQKFGRFLMAGDEGGALIADWCQPAHIIKPAPNAAYDVAPVVTAAGITKTMAPRGKTDRLECFIEQPQADVHDFYRNFVSAIRGEATQIVTHEQMRRVMTVIEAAFISDREHRIVNIEEI